MRSCTESIHLPVGADAVFRFIADPLSLPLWAVGFCRRIRREGGGWMVETPHGEVGVEFLTDGGWGTVDFLMRTPQRESRAFSRVAGDGTESVYSFTFFAQPGESDTAFDARSTALREELVVLASVLRARSACDAA